MDAIIDSIVYAIYIRPLKRFSRHNIPFLRTSSSTLNSSEKGNANLPSMLEDIDTPPITEPTSTPSSSWILAAEMDRYSTSSAESQAEYQRTVEQDERGWGRHVMKAKERLRKVRRA